GEAAGSGEVGRWSGRAAGIVIVALQVAGAIRLADGTALALDDAAVEADASAAPVGAVALLRIIGRFVEALDSEHVEREDERVDGLVGRVVERAPVAATAGNAPRRRQGCLRNDDVLAGEQSEDVLTVA